MTTDLQVVFALALAFDALPQCLPAVLAAVPVTFEKALAGLRQTGREFPRAGNSHGLDQALLAQVPQVA